MFFYETGQFCLYKIRIIHFPCCMLLTPVVMSSVWLQEKDNTQSCKSNEKKTSEKSNNCINKKKKEETKCSNNCVGEYENVCEIEK